jgi:predicted Rossmann fold nucleotide-binding protein DprA/Smf involved in DNA uptake
MTDSAWVALSLTERIGGKTLRALMAHFNHDTVAILKADATSLQQVAGVGPKLVERIQSIRLEQVEEAIPRWQAQGVQIITWDERPYPPQLSTAIAGAG